MNNGSDPGVFKAYPRRSGTGFLSALPVAMAYMNIFAHICIARRAVSRVPRSSITRRTARTSGGVISVIGLGPSFGRMCCSRRASIVFAEEGFHSCFRFSYHSRAMTSNEFPAFSSSRRLVSFFAAPGSAQAAMAFFTFVPSVTGVAERHMRIDAKSQYFLLTVEEIFQPPVFAAIRHDHQEKPIAVRNLKLLRAGLGVFYFSIRQGRRHGVHLRLVRGTFIICTPLFAGMSTIFDGRMLGINVVVIGCEACFGGH